MLIQSVDCQSIFLIELTKGEIIILVLHTMSGLVEPLIDHDEVKEKLTVEGEFSLSFYIYNTEKNLYFDKVQNKEKIELGGNKFVIDVCDREPSGGLIEKYVEARHEMYDRLNSQFIKEEYTGAIRLSACLDIALEGSGLTYEIIGEFSSRTFENFGRDKGLALFKTIKSRFGVECRPVGTHLIIASEISRVTEGQFRHGHNLSSIAENVDTTDLATYIEGFGAKDEETGQYIATAVHESPYSELYTDEQGRKRLIHADYVYDERFHDDVALLEEIKSRLKDVPDYNLKITYEELTRNGFKLHDYELGDYVWAIHEGLNIRIQPRIISIERYPFNPQISPVIELGVPRRDVTKTVANFQNAAQKIEAVEGGVTQARQLATTAQNRANEAMEAAGGSNESLSDHLNDFNRHLTDEERNVWNQKESPDGAQEKASRAEANAIEHTNQIETTLMQIINEIQEEIRELKEGDGNGNGN